MAKMRSLIKLLKRLLKSEPKKKHEQVQREKRRKWVFGRLKWKRLPVLEVDNQRRRLSDAEEEHTRHALTAAVATAAAAEAAVAAAQAAAEVVRLTRTTRSYRQSPRRSRDLAALKIQTAYRGYLARKALRALKGLVKLQALVRGQAVRRQAEMTLKGLQTIVKIQSEVRARRTRTGKVHSLTQEKEPEDKETQLQLSSFRGWDDSVQTKEDVDATMVGRQEALIKRERIKEYIMNLRERRNATQLDESEEDNNVNGCLTQWLEQWVDAHEQKSGRDFIICSNIMQSNVQGRMELRMREIEDCEQKNAVSPPRRSFDRSKRRSNGGHQSLDSPSVPNYMSATESARARLRSSSMPKQREGLMLDTFLNRGSPSKNRSSFSINSDGSTSFMSRKAPVSEQRSPCMKTASSPIKPFLIAKDFD